MLKVFIGYDARSAASYHTLSHSLLTLTSQPLAIIPLEMGKLVRATGGTFARRGTTEFTFSRWLVPWLAGREGLALFLDSDVIAQRDVSELFATCRAGIDAPAVYARRDIAGFEQAAVLMFNCEHPACGRLSPGYVQRALADELFTFAWANDAVEALAPEWHNLILYEDWDPKAGLVHHTAGVPLFPELSKAPGAKSYLSTYSAMHRMRTNWEAFLGQTRHRELVEALNAED